MPELPEVETTRLGIVPHVTGKAVTEVVVRNAALRYPVPPRLRRDLPGQTVREVGRRGKYLLLRFDNGALIIHLGMSGSLRVTPCATPPAKHDHLDLAFGTQCLRLRDPRRFGCVVWAADPERHRLLASLGVEPLDAALDGAYLWQRARGRKVTVKQFIMDSHIVVGVGNIYASESLFLAGIHPTRAAGRISLERYQRLAAAVKDVLRAAIRQGGTTLRDFTNGDGRPGYFQQQLQVYGRQGEPCTACGDIVEQRVIGQRSTYYCKRCQT